MSLIPSFPVSNGIHSKWKKQQIVMYRESVLVASLQNWPPIAVAFGPARVRAENITNVALPAEIIGIDETTACH